MNHKLDTFHFETHIPLSKNEAFEWHKRPGMLERLTPPFSPLKLVSKDAKLELDDIAHFKVKSLSLFDIDAYFKICEYQEGDYFTDEQIKGPFRYWRHCHSFKGVNAHHSIIEDNISFKTPLDHVLKAFIHKKITHELQRTFTYRQHVLLNDLDFFKEHKKSTQKKLHILMTGESGLIGSALSNFLKLMGHHVTPISSHLAPNKKAILWDIENQIIDLDDLEGYDALIHLAGENIGGIWSDLKKEKIYKSRIHSTRLLVKALNQLNSPPKVLINASGAHYYLQGKSCSEDGAHGSGFLSHVVQDWEHEAKQYKKGRVALMRNGVVLSAHGGMLQKLLPSFRAGLGATLGDGKQHVSWISIDDLIYQYYHVLVNSSLDGAINITSPHLVTNQEFTKTLAKVLNRVQLLKLPKSLIEFLFKEMGNDIFLADLQVLPNKLIENGAKFYYPTLEHALKHQLGIA